ncbi:MAG: 50S ribosomal protein L16 [Alphaproteobacteria bacterium]|nr:50S ribosomal protein L16 [Alphaproteobacteria bacterium]
MLAPKKTKYRKHFKGRIHGKATRGSQITFGDYALKALDPERVTSRQIEAARRVIARKLKRTGRVWIKIFPALPVSKKPIEVRMGKGKGNPEYWAAVVRPGLIMFEIAGVSESLAREACLSAGAKLPVRVAFVVRGEMQ